MLVFSLTKKKIRAMAASEKNEKTVPPTQLILPSPPPLARFIASASTDADGERRRTEDISGTVNAGTIDKIWTFLSSCYLAKLHSLYNSLNVTQRAKNKKDIV